MNCWSTKRLAIMGTNPLVMLPRIRVPADAVVRHAFVDDPEEDMLEGAPVEGARCHERAVDAGQERLQIVALARDHRDR